MVVLAGAVLLFYGPRVARHWELLKLQARCIEVELPADRPTVEWNEYVVRRLLATRPNEYSAGSWTSAVRPEPRWQDYSTRLGIGSFAEPRGTLFIHERCTPSGARRLVVVEGSAIVSMMRGVLWVTVVRPAGPLWGARVVVGQAIWEPSSSPPEVEVFEGGYGTDARYGAGKIDPKDRSRFSVPMTVKGKVICLDFKLADDETVSVGARDEKPAPEPAPEQGPVVDPLFVPQGNGR
jgi:hypothetical protein